MSQSIAIRIGLLALVLSSPLVARQVPNDKQKVIAGNGRPAMDCVQYVKLASGDSRLGNIGGAILANGCEDRVAITWCYVENDGCNGRSGNLWDLDPGKNWPVSAELQIRWAACHQPGEVNFEKGTAGLRAICTAQGAVVDNGLPKRAPSTLAGTFNDVILVVERRTMAFDDEGYRATAAGKRDAAAARANAAATAERDRLAAEAARMRPAPAPASVKGCISVMTDLVDVINQGNPFAQGGRLFSQGQASQSLQWEQEMWSQQILVRTVNGMSTCTTADRALVTDGMRQRQTLCLQAAANDRRTADCTAGRNYGNDEARINAAVQTALRSSNGSSTAVAAPTPPQPAGPETPRLVLGSDPCVVSQSVNLAGVRTTFKNVCTHDVDIAYLQRGELWGWTLITSATGPTHAMARFPQQTYDGTPTIEAVCHNGNFFLRPGAPPPQSSLGFTVNDLVCKSYTYPARGGFR